MQPLKSDLEDKGFTLYVVSDGSQDDLVYLGPTGFDVLVNEGPAWKAYNVTGIPNTFFVDREGKLAATSLGWSTEISLGEFQTTVESLTKDLGGG